MKVLLIFLISLVFTNLANAQLLQILNQESNEAIAYAHIIYLQNGQIQGGTYSNQNGKATIVFTAEVDSVEITCLGFSIKKISAKNLPDTIFLESAEFLLDEVAVYSNANAPLQFIGFKKDKKALPHGSFTGTQLVTLISNKDEERSIKSFVFWINKGKTSNDAKLKVIFFENNKGVPGRKIEREVLLAIAEIKEQEVIVDLDALNLVLPLEGMFVGIEWMGCVDNDQARMTQTNSEECNLTILANWEKGKKLNQTYVRDVFRTTQWFDMNKNERLSSSLIPVFGVYVYE